MNRLQQLREAAGLTYADLSRRSDVAQRVIQELEAGKNVTEAEPVVLIPGETPVEDRTVILYKLADALNATLFDEGLAVTPDELLQPAREDLPVVAEALASPSDVTQPSIPLVGVNFPEAEDLPPEARSHNTTEQPDDIDAALGQLAKNAQATASEEAARAQPAPTATQAETSPISKLSALQSTPEMPESVSQPEISDGMPEPEVRATIPTSEDYEPIPEPEMPGPAPAPETMKPASEAKPEPLKAPANLGLSTGDDLAEIIPDPSIPLVVPVTVAPPVTEKPTQDDASLTTKPLPDHMPTMQPYIKPQPTEAEKSRYKLPASTVIPSLIGVVVALGWYAWRSWRRSKTDSERVAPYYKK